MPNSSMTASKATQISVMDALLVNHRERLGIEKFTIDIGSDQIEPRLKILFKSRDAANNYYKTLRELITHDPFQPSLKAIFKMPADISYPLPRYARQFPNCSQQKKPFPSPR